MRIFARSFWRFNNTMAKKQSLEKKKQMKMQSVQRRTDRAKEESLILQKCMGLLVVLVLAEIYFLMCYRFFAQGTMESLVTMSYVIEAVGWGSLVLVVAGIAVALMRRGKKFAQLGTWAAVLGVILVLGSRLMLTIYPAGTTVMCVAVPLLALAGFVYYLYQREFFFAGLGVGLAGCGMWLAQKAVGSASWSSRYVAIEVVLLVVVAVLLVLAVRIGRNGGKWSKDENAAPVFSDTTNYTVMYASLAAAAVVVLAGIFAPAVALYLMWGCIALLFVLAVYYTIHLM